MSVLTHPPADPAAGAAIRARRRPLASLTLCALAACCFALAALGLAGRSPFVAPNSVLVLDATPSVRQRYPGFVEESRDGWKAFGGGARPVVGAGQHPLPAGSAPETTLATDVPAALRVAASLAPARVETRILLATDGLFRGEGLDETIRLLRERGAKVFALTPPPLQPQARVVDLVVPERAFPGESYPVRVRVMATQPGPARVELLRDGEPVSAATVTVEGGGVGEAEFLQEADRVGRVRFAARVEGTSVATAAGEVSIARSPRVRWLTDDPGAAGALVGLLRGAGVDVELTHPADLAVPEADLAKDEVIVLDDVPAAALTEPLVDALRGAVAGRGAGLVVLGGRKGLGSGEYGGTPLEALLPVRAGFQSPPLPGPVAMVLVLDTSFSMFFRGSGEKVFYSTEPRKIDVAKESAAGVVRVVRPGDRLGVLGNSTNIFWIAPLGEIRDREAVLERIGRIFPEGDGIYFYSVLHEAREALRHDPAGVRHVLVLCDAEDIDQYEVAGRGHSFDLVREMAREGMSLSILAIGRPSDKDVPFLRTAALLGRGDFYLVPRIVALPRYFVSEYRRISSSRYYLEEDVQPVAAEQALPAAGATGSYPALSGISLVTAREGSRTLLTTGVGAPLLVGGEFGRGRTAVFAGDNGYRWATRWLDTSAMRRFWLQLLFSAAPAGEASRGFASFLEADRERGELRFHYAGVDGGLPPWDTLWAIPAGPDAAGPPLRLDRAGLRAFRGRTAFEASGYRRVVIAEDEAGTRPLLTTGYRIPPAEEELPAPARWDLVDRLVTETGGDWVGGPEQMGSASAVRLPLPLPVLLTAAGVLLLLAAAFVRALKED